MNVTMATHRLLPSINPSTLSRPTSIYRTPNRITKRNIGITSAMSSAPESAVQHSTSPFKNARQVVKKVLSKPQSEGDGATVRRSIGRPELKQLDPFLMLDEFSVSAPAGFPDHPHRGFEIVT